MLGASFSTKMRRRLDILARTSKQAENLDARYQWNRRTTITITVVAVGTTYEEVVADTEDAVLNALLEAHLSWVVYKTDLSVSSSNVDMRTAPFAFVLPIVGSFWRPSLHLLVARICCKRAPQFKPRKGVKYLKSLHAAIIIEDRKKAILGMKPRLRICTI